MEKPKVVIFVTPELHRSVLEFFAKDKLPDFQTEIYSTGRDTLIDLSDVDGLTKLLVGVDACVISTFSDFNSESRRLEIQQGMCLGEACKKAAVKYVVFCGHLSCERAIGIPARHYDSKAEIYQYMRHNLELPVTMVSIPPLYEMFFDFLCPTYNHDRYEIAFPSVGAAPIDFIAMDDVAPCLLSVLSRPDIFMHKTVGLCGEKLTGKSVTSILNEEISDLLFKQKQVTVQDVREKNFVGAIDIANMFEFLSRGDLKANPKATRDLYSHTRSFTDWVQQNHDRLKNEMANRSHAEMTHPTVI